MSHPFDNGPGRRSNKVVSLETARKIARQRDRLAQELEKLRKENAHLKRENKRLSEAQQDSGSDARAMRQRAEEAEQGVRDLRERIEELEKSLRDNRKTRESREKTGDLIPRLKQRIETLQNDLERVRDQADQTADRASREERVRLLANLGQVLDSVERGLSMQAEGPWRQGLMAIHAQILNFFRSEGATLTGQVGETLDPTVHEAVEAVDAGDLQGVEAGEIVEVQRHGVLLEDGTQVRPAQVKVAK